MNGDHEYRLNQHYRAERQRQAEQHQLAAQISDRPRRPIRLSIVQVRRVQQESAAAGMRVPVTARTLWIAACRFLLNLFQETQPS